MRVKICGLRRPADVEACLAAGVDLLGLNFAPRSRRCLPPDVAKALAARIPEGRGVAVFAAPTLGFVQEVLAHTGLSIAQIHGPFLHLQALGGRILRALPASDLHAAPVEAPFVEGFLLDGPDPGSGQRWAWSELGTTLEGRPVWLAGGLTPDNVAEAIRRVRPAGVDVASGVEGPDRQLDPARIHAFVRAAHAEESP